jgi:tetrahydromethanopterin S-methyltransferase subunit B
MFKYMWYTPFTRFLSGIVPKTIQNMQVNKLAANFSNAEAVDSDLVDLVTTTKTWLAAPKEANFFRCMQNFQNFRYGLSLCLKMMQLLGVLVRIKLEIRL